MSIADSAAPPAKASGAPVFTKGYRGWLLFVLLMVNVLNLADRQGMAAVAPAIKADLKLSDTQLGLILGLGFALFYSLLGLPFARMSERFSRSRIIAGSVAVFGAAVALCGVAHNFWTFLLFRVGVGVGDAGMGPPVASLIGDHYPREKRASAMTVIWLGAPIGAVTGSVLGGLFAQELGWRAWFFALGAPGVLVALIAFFTLREPVRGMSDPVAASGRAPPKISVVLKFLLAKKSVVHILIGAALAATAMNGLGQFLARFIVANYHLGFAQAGQILGMIAGGSMASGLSIGGFGVDWLGKTDRRWYVWAPAIGLALTTPLFLLALSMPSLTLTVIVLFLGHITLFVYYTPTLAMAQNMVGADMRASSAFVVSLVLGLIGIGLGPTLVGVLSDVFASRAFSLGDFGASCPGGGPPAGAAAGLAKACGDASAAGVRHAIMAMSLLFAWGAVHFVLAAKHIRRDLDTHYLHPQDAAVEATEART